MGCNFYMLNGKHIGKRSAAGGYCWDCQITLCKQGENGIHKSKSTWYHWCPKCGKKSVEETLETSSAGRELGFNVLEPKKKKGVASCSSFSWDVKPEKINRLRFVKDEYRRKYRKEQFLAVLEECPIRYLDSIGGDFS